jgi:hypothetical protein
MELTAAHVALAAVAAFLVGFNKTGLPGLGLLVVPIMASLFPSRQSVGVVLPMLIFADIFAVLRYRRHADWRIILRLLPCVLAGILAGWAALHFLTDRSIQPVLGGLVLALVLLQLATERWGGRLSETLPKHWGWTLLLGFAAGFATMVGNLAGAIMTLYLLGMGLDKHRFMGTVAWYFMIVNWTKVPLLAAEGLITGPSLAFDLYCAPVIALGALAGMKAFALMTTGLFKRLVLLLAAFSAAYLLWRFLAA